VLSVYQKRWKPESDLRRSEQFLRQGFCAIVPSMVAWHGHRNDAGTGAMVVHGIARDVARCGGLTDFLPLCLVSHAVFRYDRDARGR